MKLIATRTPTTAPATMPQVAEFSLIKCTAFVGVTSIVMTWIESSPAGNELSSELDSLRSNLAVAEYAVVNAMKEHS